MAVARQRRADPPAKQVPQQRPPVTSIASQAAFQQQHQNNQSQRMQQMQQQQQQPRGNPQQHMNRANIMNQMNQNNRMQQMQQQMPQQHEISQQKMQSEHIDSAMQIPSRLTISDAIGLITLRLGKIEQYIIDNQHEHHGMTSSGSKSEDSRLPENSEIVDKSVLHNIVNRLDSIEKKDAKLDNNVIQSIENRLSNIEKEKNDVKVDNSLQISQLQNEVNTLRQMIEGFMYEMERRMGDFEFAFSEIEKNFIMPTETLENFEVEDIGEEGNVSEKDIDIQMEELDGKNIQEEKKESSTLDLKSVVEMDLKNNTMPIGY
jgi:hypothetical protein